MSTVMTLPVLPTGRIAPATLGLAVPATGALGKEIRKAYPHAFREAVERVDDEIQIEILDPLLGAASVEQLAETFERLYPKFRDYYVSTLLILWACLEEDPRRFSALTIRTFQEPEQLIRNGGQQWLAPAATPHPLMVLDTIP